MTGIINFQEKCLVQLQLGILPCKSKKSDQIKETENKNELINFSQGKCQLVQL